jgi:endonuclease/exonuclease/phosphatase family metal-dependent hydrolase
MIASWRNATIVACSLAALFVPAATSQGTTFRITTWNLQWFPNGSPKEKPASEQAQHIQAAADVLRELDPDIVLLQEMRDYDVCARLAEAIKPNTYRVAICSAFRETSRGQANGRGAIGKQQVAILGKDYAQAAWSEAWKSMEGVDPPRGFAFAWYRIAGLDIGVYCVHLKSNLVIARDKESEMKRNVVKREVSATQLVSHIRDFIGKAMPNLKAFVVGGDFNTNKDQPDFQKERTFDTLTNGGFRDSFTPVPLAQRITHPGEKKYPDATFDYLFYANASVAKPIITTSKVSDHFPVTCDFTIDATRAPYQPNVVDQQSAQQVVTLTEPVQIKIPYGLTTLPRGLKLHAISRESDRVTVKYMDGNYSIPITSTDLQP